MSDHNYPDHFYADALGKVRAVTGKPTGAYQAPAEIPPAERKLRTALAYVNHARDLIRDALGDNDAKAQRDAKIAYDMASDHPAGIGDVPHEFASGPVRFKTLEEKQAFERECVSVFASSMASIKEQHPKWDVRWGKATHQGERQHPMNAEAIRDHDERLSGAEDRL